MEIVKLFKNYVIIRKNTKFPNYDINDDVDILTDDIHFNLNIMKQNNFRDNNTSNLRKKHLGEFLNYYYEQLIQLLINFANVVEGFHNLKVDPKLTYHGHLKRLSFKHPRVKFDNLDDWDNDNPFEDAFNDLNPDVP